MKRVAIAAITAVFVLACGSTSQSAAPGGGGGKPEKGSLTMGVGGQSQIIYMPLTLGAQLGYYKDEGIDVQITDLKGGADALKALVGGSVDMVTGFYEHTIRTQTQGKYIEMITVFDEYPGLVLEVGRQHESQVGSIKDLAGRPVGVTSPGSSTDEMVKYLQKKNGMAADAIPVVGIGSGSTAIAALRSGQVWAGVTVEPTASQLEKNGDAKALYDTRTPAGTREVFGGTWPAGGFYASADFVKENPRTVQAMARAGVKTLRYIQGHSAQQIADHLPSSFYPDGDKAAFAQILHANLGMFSHDGMMPSDGPNDVFQTLKIADPKTDWSAVQLSRTYDNSFAKNAGT